MIHRRRFIVTTIAALLAAPFSSDAGFTKGRELAPFPKEFKAGDYIWHPEISPAGPVVILVSLPDQVLYVFRNGVRIGRSTVSSGTKGHRTPTGVFTVMQKKVDHESTIYKGAKMPHMQRLTWGGIAMHAGQLPGYPASHGCVRLPVDFAEKLYSVTEIGTTVIIADNESGPGTTTKPGLLFAGDIGQAVPAGAVVWQPEKAPEGPVSVILSAADRAAYIYRNGVEIGRATAGGLEHISGTHAFSALSTEDSSGRRDWLSITSVGGGAPDLKELASRISVDPKFLADARALITPGTSLIVTDAPVNANTRSDSNFSILTTSATP
ncbi:MAG: L,D-transpeptidase [Deltaproteobacteria bacterium]|nr:MAG: L,D-transpeptidase [Deltaproteobacteria bacterium]